MQTHGFVTVSGKRFHYAWLRDNCLNIKSRHPNSLEKLDDLTEHPFPPEPKSFDYPE